MPEMPHEEREERRRSTQRRVIASPEGAIGLSLLVISVLVIIFGPAVAPYLPTTTGTGAPLAGASWAHPFGTDQLGRDVYSRVLWGGRSVVVIPLIATSIAFAAGAAIGMTAGFVGGRLDAIMVRLLDVALSIPPILIVLVIIAAFGTSSPVLILSVALVYTPKIARVLRGATQSLRGRDYVVAANARGEATWWIIAKEIGPNMMPTLFVEAALRVTFTIIFVATLSFLGLGAQPPSPNWGLMVSDARSIIAIQPLAALAPALAIAVLAISINLLADALTKAFGDDIPDGVIV